MGFADVFGGNQSKKIQIIERSSDVLLTKKGEDKLGRMDASGIEYKVMSCIKESGSSGCTTEEIARKEALPDLEKVRRLLRSLISDGFVMVKE
jgi:hypothetical protein